MEEYSGVPRSSWTTHSSYNPIDGDYYGLELEMEGNNLLTMLGSTYWLAEHDGSLRNLPMSCEYKSIPFSYSQKEECIRELYTSFKDRKSTIVPSMRTSTHIHINAQDMCMTDLANFTALYLILEGTTFSKFGRHRKGNNFCVPLVDCDSVLDSVSKFIQSPNRGTFSRLGVDGFKYAAVSFRSLLHYGTLEIRTHEGVSETEQDRVLYLVEFAHKLRQAAMSLPSPEHIIQLASSDGPQAFCDRFLDGCVVDNNSFWNGIAQAHTVDVLKDWTRPKTAKMLKSKKIPTNTMNIDTTTVALTDMF